MRGDEAVDTARRLLSETSAPDAAHAYATVAIADYLRALVQQVEALNGNVRDLHRLLTRRLP